uniref:Ig-like domain-containing protein n=1 Tax=Echeneis naucrates TaxID=173247 RepID=A0A665WVZ9_ECHNA
MLYFYKTILFNHLYVLFFTVNVTADKLQASLTADQTEIPAGGSVTLSCSVKSSSGWIYYWYRDASSEPLNKQDADFQTAGSIRVSKEGVYRCRGGRGDPVYYTEYSHSVNIYNIGEAVLTLQPNWTEIFRGERITVRCDIQGGDNEWTYEWRTTSSSKPSNEHEYRISSASASHSGNYSCRGRMKSSTHDTTNWSNSVKVTVHEPRSVLTVSPSWLSPGASVTLKCEVEHSSAGWRFFWYQAVPDGSGSYTGYVCEAGRGDPEFKTQKSQPKFVWSGVSDELIKCYSVLLRSLSA